VPIGAPIKLRLQPLRAVTASRQEKTSADRTASASSEGAKEYSPARKRWVKKKMMAQAPKGRKKPLFEK
jgi:hypothetical protein